MGVLFYSRGARGYAAWKDILFRTSNLAKGTRSDNVSLDKGTVFSDFGQRQVKYW